MTILFMLYITMLNKKKFEEAIKNIPVFLVNLAYMMQVEMVV